MPDDDTRYKEFLHSVQQDVAQDAIIKLGWQIQGTELVCESPIERLMLLAFLRLQIIDIQFGFDLTVAGSSVTFDAACVSLDQRCGGMISDYIEVFQQASIGPYRVDFLVGCKAGLSEDKAARVWLVVECDGHDFHERTKQQAQHDKARDRYLVALGFRVLRFTGSEIWRDPNDCVAEVMDICDEWRNKVSEPFYARIRACRAERAE